MQKRFGAESRWQKSIYGENDPLGQSRSLKSTWIDWLPMCSVVTVVLSHTVFEINGDNCQIFPLPLYFTPPLRGSPWNFVTAVGLRPGSHSLKLLRLGS